MGLTHGAVIEMVKVSPLGDPVEYRLRNYHLSLRKSEARAIDVELISGSPPLREEQGQHKAVIPLVKCRVGQEVEIVQTRGGRGFVNRIRGMNLEPGTILQIIQNDFPGPLIISISGGDRLVIGKGMARHILVKPSCGS
jgi:Fe2+ transport system protein FeoA